MHASYPFESHYVAVRDGMKLHYIDEGAGEPVVMVHGNPTWSVYYRNLVQALQGGYRCLALDHIGMGLSDKPSDSVYAYTLQSRIDDLEAWLDTLGIRDNITLVLHDWGGAIGMGFAARHPGRIKRFVILNTAAFHLPSGKGFPKGLALTRTSLGAFLVLRFNAFSAAAARVCCTRRRMSKDVRALYCRPYDSPANRIATLRFVQDIPLKPGDTCYDLISGMQQSLPQFAETPALICWGMKDFVFDKHFLAQWEQHWPHAEVHRFPDCGHYILEDAHEEIIPLVEEFLARHPIGAPAEHART